MQKPWLVIIGIVGLYVANNIILEAIRYSGKVWNMECNYASRIRYQEQNTGRHLLCYPTTYYHIVQVDQGSGAMLLQSYYGSTEKTIGGDEFYPTIVFKSNVSRTEKVVAVGRVSDLRDGLYNVSFQSLTNDVLFKISDEQHKRNIQESGHFLRIVLQYCCGDGALPPPAKQNRLDGGAINKVVPVLFPSSLPPPPWVVRAEKPPFRQPQINLKKYDHVLALGDSLMEQMVKGGKHSGKAVAPYLTYKGMYFPLATDLMEENFIRKVREACKTPRRDACSTNKTLLLLNSGMWNLLEDGNFTKTKTCCNYDVNFDDHIRALQGMHDNFSLGLT